MKQRKIFSSLLPLFALLFCSFSSFSQKSVYWEGGTPGRENDWNCPQNWSDERTPDAFSDVIIGDVSTSTFFYPRISEGWNEINSLFIYSNASLFVEKEAALVIQSHLTSVRDESLKIKGFLKILDEHQTEDTVSKK